MQRRPRPSSLRWADIESLLVHLGGIVRQGKGSASLDDAGVNLHDL